MLWIPLVLVGSLLVGNPCCNLGPNPDPYCLSLMPPCPEGAMQAWTNAMASLVYGVFAHTSIALGGVSFLSLLLVRWKAVPPGPRFECRKCGKISKRAERQCPKCGAIDCFKPK
jgi:hypothetical protein